MKYVLTFFGMFTLSYSVVMAANQFTVLQKGQAFDRASLTVKVGDTVNFRNADADYHNIFSLSDAAFFDLGAFGQGESRSYTFDEAGDVEVECALHPDMLMTVTVVE